MEQPREKDPAELLEVELLPYDPAKADRILRRLAELLVRVWRDQGEPDIGPEDAQPDGASRVAP